MTEVESRQSLESIPSKSIKKNLNDYKLGISNVAYQVSLAQDGQAWCALIGKNIQDGIAGFGATMQEALHNLANNIQE